MNVVRGLFRKYVVQLSNLEVVDLKADGLFINYAWGFLLKSLEKQPENPDSSSNPFVKCSRKELDRKSSLLKFAAVCVIRAGCKYAALGDLLVTLSTLLRGSVYERLRWAFKLYDINGDGCISRGELSEIVTAIHDLIGRRTHHHGEDERKTREQVDRVFRKLDLNQDGVITIEEFMESCLKDDMITRSLQIFDVAL
ncbi:hypothetical protein ILUMI_26970 [Ignelater luminosus]|uniref:EF-hand domain-containing protein n=1 Tax=Ignelater luminosus TaxID=2038154 RepID=A0A8K0C3D8_IGNLU|nr:hypothetical protein ILUMI_26970 [Ignelater luminosus]